MSEEIKNLLNDVLGRYVVLRYSVRYVPAYKGYVVTIVTPRSGMSSDILERVVSSLKSQGYKVTIKGSSSFFFNVLRLIVTK